MSLMSVTPSRSASTAYCFQVDGMNCMGPTARSQLRSVSSVPPSVSGMDLRPPCPSSGGPMIAGSALPSACSVAPWARPWSDSTLPIPASVVQLRLQAGWLCRATSSAYAYACSATTGMLTLMAIGTAQLARTSAGRPVALALAGGGEPSALMTGPAPSPPCGPGIPLLLSAPGEAGPAEGTWTVGVADTTAAPGA